NWSQVFTDALAGTKILNLQAYQDNQTAQLDLAQGRLQAVVIIPAGFGASCFSFLASPGDASKWVNTSVPLYFDGGSLFATQALAPIFQQVLGSLLSASQTAARPVQLSTPSLVEVDRTSAFDYMAPGMFAFASIFMIMIVAQSFSSDKESGLLRRIRMTPTTPSEFIGSQVVSSMVTAVIQAAIIFALTYLMGFRPPVSVATMTLAFALVLVFSLCNVGFGLITATLAKSSGGATGIAFIFLLPQLFLGTFVGASLSGAAQSVSRFVPSYYMTDALTSLLLRGAPMTSPTILMDALVLSISSIAILAAGIWLFGRHLRD
ncbi:MAG: ABC transporter permease, partial [Candidatus Methanomethylicus sp.]|nr:ABC transporter permease [Candidatus Methanomethylicus sp.]